MPYSLTPVVVDLRRIKALMGSKDVRLLRSVIKEHRREMLRIEAVVGNLPHFAAEVKKEYKSFAAGDFSAVDLYRVYPAPAGDEEEDDEETDEIDAELDHLGEEFTRAYRATRSKRTRERLKDKFLEVAAGLALQAGPDDEVIDQEPVRQLTTGAALAHLLLGGHRDPSAWSQYGYALQILCRHLGDVPDHDGWFTIRSAVFDIADRLLRRAGVPPKVFSTEAFLTDRGPPVKILEPDDFPYVGYLRRSEVRRVLRLLDPAKLDAAIRRARDGREWARHAFAQLRGWLEEARETDRDLICFYC